MSRATVQGYIDYKKAQRNQSHGTATTAADNVNATAATAGFAALASLGAATGVFSLSTMGNGIVSGSVSGQTNKIEPIFMIKSTIVMAFRLRSLKTHRGSATFPA